LRVGVLLLRLLLLLFRLLARLVSVALLVLLVVMGFLLRGRRVIVVRLVSLARLV
jgi:hypothetical protein